MKHIKLLEEFFYGGKYLYLGSFGHNDFDKYSEIVEKWKSEKGKSVKELDGLDTYKNFLRSCDKIALVEGDEDLYFVLIDNNQISYNTHSSFGHENIFNQNIKLVDSDTAEQIRKVVYKNI